MTLAACAQRYAQRGLHVFPCHPRSKRPATRNGLKDATADLGLIEGWWQAQPDANVAIRTGQPSGLVVLDVDGDDGEQSLRVLLERHGPLPPTVHVRTPRGGSHYWFRHPGQHVGCSAGKLGAGLDVRGDGGYILAPPSINTNGTPYTCAARGPLADPPDWLTGDLRPAGTRRPPVPAAEWIALVENGAPEGARNASLARLTGHLLGKHVDARLVLALAHLANGRNRPPLPSDEVDRIVESIAGAEVRKRETRRAAA